MFHNPIYYPLGINASTVYTCKFGRVFLQESLIEWKVNRCSEERTHYHEGRENKVSSELAIKSGLSVDYGVSLNAHLCHPKSPMTHKPPLSILAVVPPLEMTTKSSCWFQCPHLALLHSFILPSEALVLPGEHPVLLALPADNKHHAHQNKHLIQCPH